MSARHSPWVLVAASLAFALPALQAGDDEDQGGFVQVVEPATAPVGTPEVRRPWLRAEGSIEIAAPVERVWAYVGDSTRAREWSIYFHHISPLPGPPDGQVGALRRCFRRADEQGTRWDERVRGGERLRVRHIVSYDFVGIPVTKGAETDVWQLYESLGPDRTRLTFRTAPVKGTNLANRLSFAGSRRRAAEIFQKNLENIAAAIEGRPQVHPYESP